MEKIQSLAVKYEACRIGVEPEALAAFVEVESGGKGFDETTGRIIIQFEPSWFRKFEPYAPSGAWSVNGVERQKKEWVAFNDAWKISPKSAMMATSIGIGQIMGMHWNRLGYSSVDAMWDDAKSGEDRQIHQIAEYIRTDPVLLSALNIKDWHIVAVRYNGKYYREMAKKWGREPYDISMRKAYEKYINQKV